MTRHLTVNQKVLGSNPSGTANLRDSVKRNSISPRIVMTRNKFIMFVNQIKRLIREIDQAEWMNPNGLNLPSYGSFYRISLDILAEAFDKKKYQKIFLGMMESYECNGKFTRVYDINGELVRTPIELYDFAMKNK